MTEPEADDAAARRARLRTVRAWLSTATLVVLLAGAAFLFLFGYGFFGVVLVVLALFAAIDLTWTLRRRR